MPIYEYECQSCQWTDELLVRRADDAVQCPSCGAVPNRLMSLTAAPAMNGGAAAADRSPSLPIGAGEPCGMPRCCGGGCST